MTIVKPQRLKPGDVIGICAPASAPDDDNHLEKGIRYLERLGYRVEPGRHLHKRRGYLAGTDAERAEDINRFFADRNIKAIISARGGYGSLRILSLLDFNMIRRAPKIFVGYSDLTALHLALLTRCGLISFSGPMVASDFGKNFGGKAEEQFWRLLASPTPPDPLKGTRPPANLKAARRTVEGRIIGGNLSLLAAMLGTPYVPRIERLLLFLEEIDERPYRIDRILQQMRLAGFLDRARGIILGQFVDCGPAPGKPSLTLREVFTEAFGDTPVVAGLPFGHISNPLTLPIGIRARLDPARQYLTFLESPVRP